MCLSGSDVDTVLYPSFWLPQHCSMLRVLAFTVAASLLDAAQLVAGAYEPPAVSTHFSGQRHLLQGSSAAAPASGIVINGTDVYCDNTLCLTASSVP